MSAPTGNLNFFPHVHTADALSREPDHVRREVIELNCKYLGIDGFTAEQLFYLTPQTLREVNAVSNQPGTAESDTARVRDAGISEIGTRFRLFINMAHSAIKQKRAGRDEIELVPACLDGRFDCI